MADDKKKEKPAGWNLDAVETAIVLLFLLGIVGSLVPSLLNLLTTGEFSFYGLKLSRIVSSFKSILPLLKAFGVGLAAAAAIGIILLNRKADSIAKAVRSKVYPTNLRDKILKVQKKSLLGYLNPFKSKKARYPISSSDLSFASDPGSNVSSGSDRISSSFDNSGLVRENKFMGRWEKIIKLSESQNQSDWRLSVIEADILLNELLNKLQLPGQTMGEKLEAVEQSDFTTIEQAWEAHKARNAIAHEGSNFLINQREIRRIISLYEAVFKEFQLI